MKQQENAEKGTQQRHKDLLADGVYLWEVHIIGFIAACFRGQKYDLSLIICLTLCRF